MKTTTLVIGIIIALIIGTGAGFLLGKGMSANGADTGKLQEALSMMKKQSSSIQAMGDLMTSSGLAAQEAGIKYQDEGLTSKGKDLVAVGKKYMEEDAKLTEKDSSME